MRILTYTTLFPNNASPLHSLFVRARVAAVAKQFDTTVVAPVPYFPKLPFNLPKRFKKYESYSKVTTEETQLNLKVYHPRFPTFPGVAKSFDGHFLSYATQGLVQKLHHQQPFDLIDAHWGYPDGYAAYLIAKKLKLPYTITVRGDDLSTFPKDPGRRKRITEALSNASHVIGVCNALCEAAIELGASPDKTTAIGNGVDTALFQQHDKLAARQQLGLPQDKKIILSVGHLCERKGFHILVEAIELLQKEKQDDITLVIVGANAEEGSFESILKEKIKKLPKHAVLLAGAKPPKELPLWYSAADLFCLASSREGWANVLLESLSCGTPVVATDIWGTPEVITSSDYGLLTARSGNAFAESISEALNKQWDHDAIKKYAQNRTWDNVANEVVAIFNKII